MTSAFCYSDDNKADLIEALRNAIDRDMLVQSNYYWSDELRNGTFLGVLSQDKHGGSRIVEESYGIDQEVGFLIDQVAQHCSDHTTKVIEIIESIPVGADVSDVPLSMLAWMFFNEDAPIKLNYRQCRTYRSYRDELTAAVMAEFAGERVAEHYWSEVRAITGPLNESGEISLDRSAIASIAHYAASEIDSRSKCFSLVVMECFVHFLEILERRGEIESVASVIDRMAQFLCDTFARKGTETELVA